MALSVTRGVKSDLPFELLTGPGGSLTDDQDWVDGTTAGQWPVVQVFNPSNADVTSSFAFNISAETLPGGAIKHPTTSTGIWRLSIGQYRIRVLPNAGLTLTDYTVKVTYDIGTTSFNQSHVLTLLGAGSVIFGSGLVTVAQVTNGIETSLGDDIVQDLISEAADFWARGRLIAAGTNPDVDFATSVPESVLSAIILYARALVFERDASARRKISTAMEGTKRLTFAGQSSKDAQMLRDRAKEELMFWIGIRSPKFNPHFTVIRRRYGSYPPTSEDGGFRS